MRKKLIRVIVMFVILLFTVISAYAFDWNYWEDSERGTGPIETGWYDVSPWELEVCYKWGGPEHTSEVATGVKSYVYTTTATIQGLKDTINYTNGTVDRIYQVGWYVRPIEGSVDFTVKIEGDSESMDISSGTADMSGKSGYYTSYLEEDYATAVLQFGSLSLRVDIAEIE